MTKIFSGVTSDWIGRRKPLVLLGYALSAVNKLLFPLAGAVSIVLLARVVDLSHMPELFDRDAKMYRRR